MLLIKFDFSKANVIPVKAWNQYLVAADLLAVFRKKLISFVQVLQGRVMTDLTTRA
jgi:hypothetical protein